jgi:hypothetical protein
MRRLPSDLGKDMFLWDTSETMYCGGIVYSIDMYVVSTYLHVQAEDRMIGFGFPLGAEAPSNWLFRFRKAGCSEYLPPFCSVQQTDPLN